MKVSAFFYYIFLKKLYNRRVKRLNESPQVNLFTIGRARSQNYIYLIFYKEEITNGS